MASDVDLGHVRGASKLGRGSAQDVQAAICMISTRGNSREVATVFSNRPVLASLLVGVDLPRREPSRRS
jgi:hypothetical protein